MNEEHGCLELKHGAGLDWRGGPEASGLRSDEKQTDGIIAEVGAIRPQLIARATFKTNLSIASFLSPPLVR